MEKRHLYMDGMMVGASQLTNLLFDPEYPYTGCRVCGEVFQSRLDRVHNPTNLDMQVATENRRSWSVKHAKRHTEKEHLNLAYSGRWCTPEAALKLASYGVIAVTDMVLSEEHEKALMESKSVPINDAEGS